MVAFATAFLALDHASTWAFEAYFTPMQQRELIEGELRGAHEAAARGNPAMVREHLIRAEEIVAKAATFTRKGGALLFDEAELTSLRAPIAEARRELLPRTG